MEPEEYIDAGDCVVVILRMSATGAKSGVEVNRQDGLVYRLRDGKVAQARLLQQPRPGARGGGAPRGLSSPTGARGTNLLAERAFY